MDRAAIRGQFGFTLGPLRCHRFSLADPHGVDLPDDHLRHCVPAELRRHRVPTPNRYRYRYPTHPLRHVRSWSARPVGHRGARQASNAKQRKAPARRRRYTSLAALPFGTMIVLLLIWVSPAPKPHRCRASLYAARHDATCRGFIVRLASHPRLRQSPVRLLTSAPAVPRACPARRSSGEPSAEAQLFRPSLARGRRGRT